MKRPACGCFLLLTLASQSVVWADDFFEPEIPEVLTPVRLQQPLAEVPASVTVITAEQLRLWGVKDIASAFRFVPGMFVAQELATNSSSVVYHSGESILARRLEVLVDGRSVYKASFANVNWDQLNIAVDDIARIEITRGPSAASYGMNAFQGVIHIITRHPADAEAGVVALTAGTGERRHGYASVAFQGNEWQQSLSLHGLHEGEDNTFHADSGDVGGFPDFRQSAGLFWSGAVQLDGDDYLRWQAGRERTLRDVIADSNFQTTSPQEDAVNDMLWTRWRHQQSASHEWQLQAYWNATNTESGFGACVPTVSLDPDMSALYQSNPDLAEVLGLAVLGWQNGSLTDQQQVLVPQLFSGLAAGLISVPELESLLLQLRSRGVAINDDDYQLARRVAASAVAADGLAESACGEGNLDIYEQRLDLEWQDTVRWNDQLRSVQGIGYRRDEVNSETYMNGSVRETQWLAFTNIEYRPLPELITTFGLMAEYRPDEDVRYSPRVGLNYLLGQQQSIRFQVARSRRTPDLAERYLDAQVRLRGLSDNYLGLSQGSLFYRARASDYKHQLMDEEIVAAEIGYFQYLSDPAVQLDIKFYQERLLDLISSHITLRETVIDNHGSMTLRGVEGQVSWQPFNGQNLAVGWLAQDRSVNNENEVKLGAENSLRLSWSQRNDNREAMLGLLWDINRNSVAAGAPQGRYEQRTLLGRWAFNSGFGTWSVSSEYNPLAGQVLYERSPRWLNRLGWRLSW
ncbi:TonB-dependent receptor plug domain-containing protein [Thalassolituus sp. LLYu03]|uniref:TonB-dependent receptor plug domain-containing protein n=1 Tax=Thalassolituus sp. LLYu03 TaxID=3421656 RepID=UPI003D26E6E3